MSDSDLTTYLQKHNLIIISKDVLDDYLIKINLQTQVDKRVKWIDKKTAIKKYNVSAYWLKNTNLKKLKAGSNTSKIKYNEQSIVDALEKQSMLCNNLK